MARTKRAKLLDEASRSRARAAREAQGARNPLNTDPRSIALAVAAAFVPWFVPAAHGQIAADTLPGGGQVAAGAANISTNGSKMQIDQSTNRAILNWQSFSIGSSAWVNFSQPGASAVALNRVVGNDPSHIFGRLTANGQVFLVNNAGVLFAPGASVNVGALFATSLSINDQDFLAGRYQFFNPGNAGSVVNQGNIVTANGYTALVGPQVRNDGVIIARTGSITLAAADRVSLDMVGDGLISISVDQATLNASVINTGTLQADGGTVLLAARSANALLDTVINNSGIIRANSLVERNGQIVLDGGSAGVVANSGTLQAAGVEAGTTGGTVKMLGQYVGLFDNAAIDASGDAGGGTALVGGNWQGQGPEQNATATYVGRNATINVDAVTTGNGGKAVVWADDTTRFYGGISAKGGSTAGDGGAVEVSGKRNLDFDGRVALGAPHGKAGSLLLDPLDIIIHGGAAQSDDGQLPTTAFSTDANDTYDISEAALEAITIGTVTLEARHSITTTGAFDNASGNPGDADTVLAFQSGVSVVMRTRNSTAATDGAGGIDLTGGDLTEIKTSSSATVVGSITLHAGTAIAADNDGATVDLSQVKLTTLASIVGSASGSVSVRAFADVSVKDIETGSHTATAGNAAQSGGITITSDTANVTVSGPLGTGAANASAGTNAVSGTILVSGDAGNVSVAAVATGAATAGSGLATSGLINVHASAGTDVAASGALSTGAANANAGTHATSGSILVTAGTGDVSVAGVVTGNSTAGTGAASSGQIILNAGGGADATASGALTTGVAGATAGTSATSGSISASSGSGNVSVVSATTGSATGGSTTATSGDIALNAGTGVDATASAALTTGAADAALGTSATSGSLSASSGTGNVSVAAITTGAVTAGSGAATRGGVTASAGIDLTLNGAISAAGASVVLNFGQSAGGTFSTAFGITGASVAINGGAGADTFDFSAAPAITANLDGNGGTDTLEGRNAVANTWNITGANAGDVGALNFVEIESVTAGSTGDSFVFTGTGSLATVTGGAGGDTINIAGKGGGNTVTLTNTEAGSIAGIVGTGFTEIENFVGQGTDSLQLDSSANTATINAPNAGSLGTGETFSGFNALLAGSGGDSFVFTLTGSIASITGGAGSDTVNIAGKGGGNTVALTNTEAGSIAGIVTAGFTEIENFTGSGADSLQLDNTANTATISGVNSGSLGTGETFSGFNTLLAGTAGDTFAITTGSMPMITGNTGTDTVSVAGGLVVTLTNTATGSVNTTPNSSFTSIENYVGTATDTLQLDNSANTAAINAPSAGSLGTGETFSGFGTLAAGTAGDSFVFTATGSIAAIAGNTGGDTINIAGKGGGNTVALSNTEAGSITGIVTAGFTEIENFTGSGTDSLQLDNSANTATIDAPNAGSLGTGETFSGFNTLRAGGGGDSFVFTLSGSLATVTGGAGGDTINIAGKGGGNTVTLTNTEAGSIATIVTAGFTEIENVTGSGTDSLQLDNSANTATINAPTAGSLGTGETFSGFNTLLAGSGGDSFDFTATGSVLTVTGGAGSDTISGNASYSISAPNTGSATGVGSFTNIETLTGTGGDDTFTLQAGVTSFNGTINGGGGSDALVATDGANAWVVAGANAGTLNGSTIFNTMEMLTGGSGSDSMTGTGGADAFTVSGVGSGSVAGMNFSSMQSLDGAAGDDSFTLQSGVLSFGGSITGGANSDSLIATDGTNAWAISTANTGTLNGSTSFNTMETLTGGSGADTFTLPSGLASFVGTINGGGGSDALVATDGANAWVVTGANAGTLNGTTIFATVDTLAGGSGSDSLTGTGGADAFSISAVGSGSVAGMSFTSMQSLNGAAGNDTFTLQSGVPSFGGSITGGADSDSVIATDGTNAWAISAANTGTLNGTTAFATVETLTGGSGADTFTLASGVTSFVGTINGGAGSDSLAATNGTNNWILTSVGSGTLNATTSFTSIETMVGGTGTDNLSGTATGGTTTMTDPTSLLVGMLNAAGGVVNLTAGSLGGTGVITSDSGTFSSGTNVIGIGIDIASNLHMDGAATLWNFSAGSDAGSFSVANANISVQVGGVIRVASVGQQQAAAAIGNVAEQIGATIVEEANKTFGTDSVAEDVEYGFAGEIGATPPMDHRIDESGISLPRCVQEAREGLPCK